jgi:nitrite reductase/ring-hydroxylating ferredoxin subunit
MNRALEMVTASGIATAFPRTSAQHPPSLVASWTMLCASRELKPGQVKSFELGNSSVVIFRGRENGVVYALPAHCAHQGIDLGRGYVAGNRLRCPLHHWEYSDRCEVIPGGQARPDAPPVYVTRERFGMVFVHPASDAIAPLPGFSVDDEQLAFHDGRAVTLGCPWYVPIANAFDMVHLRTVHHRALKEEPRVSRPDPLTFHVEYSTSVIGKQWSDRAMRLLSHDDIRVRITCRGSLMRVESQAGSRRSFLLVGVRPTVAGVSILPLTAVSRDSLGGHHLRVRVASLLFRAFLERDLHLLDGIQFPMPFREANDTTLNECYRYLCDLPGNEKESLP